MRPFFSISARTTVIDCGATRTSLGVFRATEGRLRCSHWATELFPAQPPGEDAWLEHTTAALQALNAGRRWSGPVVLVLPAHLMLTKQVRTPAVEPAKRAKVIRFEAGQAIPHPLSEVVWDWVAAGGSGAGEDIVLVAARRESVEPLCVAVEAAGFRPGRILPSALATLAGFRLARPAVNQPGLVLNVGGRSTVLLQVDQHRFAARALALGGASVTQQLAESQDCDWEEAERIKRSAGSAELAAEATETLVGRLAQEMSRSVLHFGRQCGLANPGYIALTGGGARLAGVAEGLGTRLRIPVETFAVGGAVDFDGEKPPGCDLTDLAGAAAIVLRPGQPTLDLLPPAWCRRESLRRRQPWLMAAAVLLVASLLPPILHDRAMARTVRARIDALERELVPLRERERTNRARLAQLEQLRSQVARLESLQARRGAWVRLLAGLQERLAATEDVWLDQLRPIISGEGAPVKLAVSGWMLLRSGRTDGIGTETHDRVRAMLAGLASLPAVGTVEDERFDPSQPGLLRFDVVLVTDPAHPL